jgi:hypothetical protein
MRLLCALIIMSVGAAFAREKPDDPGKPGKPSQAERPKVEVTDKKLFLDTGKKDKGGKAITREFPTMFDIADKARKIREKKARDKR